MQAIQLPKRTGMVTVKGRVNNYSNTDIAGGTYHRPLVRRVLDALLYAQRVEDHLHMFMVRTGSPDPLAGGQMDVPVNVHGTICGGASLADNMVVEVTGRIRNGVLMAESIDIVSGSRSTRVQFQCDLREVVSVFCPVILVAVIALGVLSGGGLGLFVATWLFTSTVLGVAWFFLLSRLGIVALLLLGGRDGGARFPAMAILVAGLVITVAFW